MKHLTKTEIESKTQAHIIFYHYLGPNLISIATQGDSLLRIELRYPA